MKIVHRATEGATLVELIVIMAVVGILARVVTLNLFQGQQRASLTVTRDLLISDIRKQQHRAMVGMTSTPGVYLDYSIRFEAQRYILYPGIVYDSNNVANEVTMLDPVLQFDPIDVSGGTVTFSRVSGEVRGYDENNRSITLKNIQTGSQYVISFNTLGVPFVQ